MVISTFEVRGTPAYYQKLRMELKAKGICTRCRKIDAEPFHTKCQKCLNDGRKKQ